MIELSNRSVLTESAVIVSVRDLALRGGSPPESDWYYADESAPPRKAAPAERRHASAERTQAATTADKPDPANVPMVANRQEHLPTATTAPHAWAPHNSDALDPILSQYSVARREFPE